MPVRPRRNRRAKFALTPSLDIDLMIGPGARGESVGVLGQVFKAHRWRYPEDSWAVQFFVHGIDTRPESGDPADAVEDDTDAVLPGTDAYWRPMGAERSDAE